VLPYEEQGQKVEAFTNMGGIFARSAERKNAYPFALPQSWIAAKDKLDASTPFNFVSTCDIIGGNSGSPVINREGQVVGLIFDGNIQSLVGNVAYTERRLPVSVDSRAMTLMRGKIYGGQKLADELTRASKEIRWRIAQHGADFCNFTCRRRRRAPTAGAANSVESDPYCRTALETRAREHQPGGRGISGRW
jgi:hypothetical protein